MFRSRIGLALALVCCWVNVAAADPSHVRAQLLADVSAIVPGRPFMLGVQLWIDPLWHVYWKNPGDAGLPTRVKFTVPSGFTVGPLLFPTPIRIDQPGNIVVLGYENSVLLLAEVTPPAQLPADFTGEFSAAISWLVCSDVCILGKTTVNLTLGGGASAAPANSELFDAAKAQLPMDVSASADVAHVSTSGQLTQHDQTWVWSYVTQITWKHDAPADVQFVPGALDIYNIHDTRVVSTQDKTTISFTVETLAGKNPQPATLEAVVGYKDTGGNRRGVNIIVSLPPPQSKS
jgi:DsbC/DsbD-like thiol-disulfide interchange protein